MRNIIGFNIKFKESNNFAEKELISFINGYNSYTNVVQIKFGKHNTQVYETLKIIHRYFKGDVFIHLRNNDFFTISSLKELDVYSDYKNFVIHIFENFTAKACYKNLLLKYQNIYENKILLLENNDDINDLNYLFSEVDLFFHLYNNVFPNIKFCFDIGHAFFKKNHQEQYKIAELFCSKKFLLQNTGLFHLHGLNETRHSSIRICASAINYDALNLLFSHNSSPIILEVYLSDITEMKDELNFLRSRIDQSGLQTMPPHPTYA